MCVPVWWGVKSLQVCGLPPEMAMAQANTGASENGASGDHSVGCVRGFLRSHYRDLHLHAALAFKVVKFTDIM